MLVFPLAQQVRPQRQRREGQHREAERAQQLDGHGPPQRSPAGTERSPHGQQEQRIQQQVLDEARIPGGKYVLDLHGRETRLHAVGVQHVRQRHVDPECRQHGEVRPEAASGGERLAPRLHGIVLRQDGKRRREAIQRGDAHPNSLRPTAPRVLRSDGPSGTRALPRGTSPGTRAGTPVRAARADAKPPGLTPLSAFRAVRTRQRQGSTRVARASRATRAGVS